MLFARQKRLLALVDAHGGEIGSLDFQKLLLIYCQEMEEMPSYEFVPYKYGGFSFTSYADRRRLVEHGFLADEDRSWKLTQEGRVVAATIEPITRGRMVQFADRYAVVRGDTLVAETYRRLPYYAIRSEMAERVLMGDTAALRAVHDAQPGPHRPGICTIGYEGRTLEGYLNCLIQNSVTVLCDVRRNPLSRKYGFSKGSLGKACEGVGIRYEHLPELGIASEDRRELHTQADYDALFAVYERETLARQAETLDRIRAWVAAGERVALTCYERLPEQCHRHCVANAMQREHDSKEVTVHL